ncbi:MAG: hypothetical protein EXR91_09685 [Gemmatimonadetes bacterium]|nr:hypothetical protein [Gemmatimonadota bacterium]
MRIASIQARSMALCAALVAAVASPASAQSQLDTSQAQAFLGNWTLPLTTDMGAMSMEIKIVDQGGKVAASFGTADLGLQDVSDITRAGEAMHMSFFVDVQGQSIDIALVLTPDGDGLNVDLAAMGGSFLATGRATRAAS